MEKDTTRDVNDSIINFIKESTKKDVSDSDIQEDTKKDVNDSVVNPVMEGRSERRIRSQCV